MVIFKGFNNNNGFLWVLWFPSIVLVYVNVCVNVRTCVLQLVATPSRIYPYDYIRATILYVLSSQG